jgi:hypothetical protein
MSSEETRLLNFPVYVKSYGGMRAASKGEGMVERGERRDRNKRIGTIIKIKKIQNVYQRRKVIYLYIVKIFNEGMVDIPRVILCKK